ncbi:hypothetical protein ACFSTE_12325 [Aquimarina hainanensis]|uniref:Glycine dehydrogenase n=1 Tax=Aquimarina hainanensis TaxID=1578017 RepID=A0ABW5NB27_9FLAO|nr:hypothetical protein [Aquimarina sp. TRL1]QKX03791.1 hypothetical protein HN014_02270 [Aquimarina sp. TRL1]
MSKASKFFINCEEANLFCDKDQYEEASFWEKIRLKIHVLYCRVCQKYVIRNRKLTNTMKEAKVITINQEVKEIMKKRLQQEMKKSSNQSIQS